MYLRTRKKLQQDFVLILLTYVFFFHETPKFPFSLAGAHFFRKSATISTGVLCSAPSGWKFFGQRKKEKR